MPGVGVEAGRASAARRATASAQQAAVDRAVFGEEADVVVVDQEVAHRRLRSAVPPSVISWPLMISSIEPGADLAVAEQRAVAEGQEAGRHVGSAGILDQHRLGAGEARRSLPARITPSGRCTSAGALRSS